MMRSRAALTAAALVACLVAGWWFLAPASLGGRATYVVTHGVSMEPAFHTGDLAIVYPTAQYRVGQVVAYRSRLLHTIVLHRIIARHGERFVFKGDNNTWRDPEHPTRDQLVGRLVVHLPRGGTLLGWAHNPYLTASLAFAIALAGAATTHTRRRRRRVRAETKTMNLHLPRLSWTPAAAAVGAAALAAVAVTVVGFAAAPQTLVTRQVPWSEQVAYGYTAATSPTVVYPDGRVHPGQTVFRRLVHQLQINATWTLHATVPHHITGTASLQATLTDATGWSHRLTLTGPTPFTGNRVGLTGTLDLKALDRITHQAEHLTGVSTDSYTLTLRPRVQLHGTLADHPLTLAAGRAFNPLTLQVTPASITPAAPVAAAGQPDATTLPAAVVSHTTTVTHPADTAWPLFGHSIPLRLTRLVTASAAALLLVAFLALLLTRRPDRDRCRRSSARHRRSIVPVQHLSIAETRTIVEVTNLDALARIAARYDRLILQPTNRPGTYLVDDDTSVYRYQCHGPHHVSAGRRRATPSTPASA